MPGQTGIAYDSASGQFLLVERDAAYAALMRAFADHEREQRGDPS